MRQARLVVVSVLAVGLAAGVTGTGGAAAQKSPVYRVSFRFTSVEQSRPPNIVETRIAGSGTLSFDHSPIEGDPFSASSVSATGKVVVEWDVLSPSPETEQATFSVTSGVYHDEPGSFEVATVGLTVVSSTSSSYLTCKIGGTTNIATFRRSTATRRALVVMGLPDCGMKRAEGQSAAIGRNSQVQVSFQGHCLRTTAAVGQPTCGSPEPTTLTLTVNGRSGTATTAKPSFGFGQSPLVVPYGTTLNIKVSANAPMPKGWKIETRHNGDVLSTGSGDYPVVCLVQSGASSCSVTRPPPTAALTGDVDDTVYAELLAPGHLVRTVYILVNYRK